MSTVLKLVAACSTAFLTLSVMGCVSFSPSVLPSSLTSSSPPSSTSFLPEEEIPELPPSMWSPSKRLMHSYVHILQGRLMQLDGRMKEALKHYEAGYVLKPGAFMGAKMLEARLQSGDYKGSLKEAQKMTLLYPRSAVLRVLYGNMLLSSKQFSQAEEQLRVALELSDTTEEAYLLLGDLLLWQKRVSEAETLALRFQDKVRGSVHAWMLLIQAKTQNKKFEEAQIMAQKAVKLFPRSTVALLSLAYLSARLSQIDRALTLYARIHRKADLKHLQELMSFYETLEGLEQAYATLDDLILDPEDQKYLPLEQQKLWILIKQKSFDQAISSVESLNERFPGEESVLFAAGLTYRLAGRKSEALDYWSRLSEESVYFSPALREAAQLARELKETHLGVSLVERLLAWGALRKEERMFGAAYYRSLGFYEAALSLVLAGQELFPEDPDFLFFEAHLHYDLSQDAALESTLEELLERYPDHHRALNFLGYFYAERGKHLEKAEKLILRALKHAPKEPAYLDSLAWVYFKQERWDLAERYLLKALSYDPQDGVIYSHMAEVLLKKGACGEALDFWAKALEDKSLEDQDRNNITERIKQVSREECLEP